MKAISVLLYEVDLNEIARLPNGFAVLQYDTQYGCHAVKEAGVDKLPTAARFKFFLFEAPPLPKISEQYKVTAGAD